jgi:hypothetical protein
VKEERGRAAMKFLRPVGRYELYDHKTNEEIREQLNIYSLN